MARFHVFAIMACLSLFGHIAVAQHRSRNSTTVEPTTTVTRTITKTRKPSSSAPAVSSFSSTQGPFLMVDSSTWSQFIIPTTVGTVMVTVNEATNKTISTTIYHTDYEINGTVTLLSRTNTNAAGTVTQVVSNVTVTYPTNYFEAAASLRWNAILPTTIDSNATCCFGQSTYSPTPTHTPFVQTGDLDVEDSRGWLYTLVGVHGQGYTVFQAAQVSSLWSNQTLSIEYGGCPYTRCTTTAFEVAPASGVAAYPGHILATRTTTISSLPTGSSTSAEPASTPKTALSATGTALQEQMSSSQSLHPGNTSPGSTPQSTAQPSTSVSGAPAAQAQDSQLEQKPSESESPLPVPAQSSVATPDPARSSSLATASETTNASSTPLPDATAAPQPNHSPSRSISGPTGAVITVGSAIITANSASLFIIADQTLAPGSSITLGSGPSATVVALQTSAPTAVLVVGDSSFTLKATGAPVITIGSLTLSADSASRFVFEGQTLAPGSRLTIGSGASTTVIALQTSEPGTVLVIENSSATLARPATPPPPALTIGSSTFSADSASRYMIEGQTLAPGSSITIGSGAATTVIALHTGAGPVLVVGGSSATLLRPATPRLPAVTLGISADAVAGQTHSPGASSLGLASGGSQLVEGAATVTPARSTGRGGIISSVLDGVPAATATATGTAADTPTAAETGAGGASATPATQRAVGASVGKSWAAVSGAGLLCIVVLGWGL
ncbi:hypothetical protein B2J93_5870 [Marssonina coronariae]|uniref:Uncharacterized protein n=1 Tax=Diplocarpon coronariae TaxID=2795749 RepID=A0A218Z756_9HELO|nr:hypothetical protein B2J93_5870 [Marssonina coronariae]